MRFSVALATNKIEHMSELDSSIVELLRLKFNVNKEIQQILSSKFTLEVTVSSVSYDLY